MKSKGAGFFNIDRRIWWALCATGKINLPVAYLTVANGTGRDNKTSKWSAKSCEMHAGMHRSRATKAIQELLDQGFLSYGEGHIKAFSRYLLTDWPTFAEKNIAKKIASLSPTEKAIVKASLAGKVDAKSPKAVVDRKSRDLLVSLGVLQMRAGGFVCTSPGGEAPSTAEDLIWLPNTLVQGAAAELSPLARLKAAGDVWCLRILVDLYHAHNLAADGGVGKSMIR